MEQRSAWIKLYLYVAILTQGLKLQVCIFVRKLIKIFNVGTEDLKFTVSAIEYLNLWCQTKRGKIVDWDTDWLKVIEYNI